MEPDSIGGKQNGNVNDNAASRGRPPRVRKRTTSSTAKGKRQVASILLLIISMYCFMLYSLLLNFLF